MSIFGAEVSETCILIFDEEVTKDAALDQLVDAVSRTGAVTDREALRTAVQAREDMSSTGIGNGLAIPHVRVDAISEPVVGVGISPAGIDYHAADDRPVHLVVLFAMPSGSGSLYLRLLAQAMLALKSPDFRRRLVACNTPEQAVAILNGTEELDAAGAAKPEDRRT